MHLSPRLEEYRIQAGEWTSRPGARYGAFSIPGPCGERLAILACDATEPESAGWEHVSVSTRRRIPNWIEMSFVKSLFWSDEECVMQLHPPASAYVNNHPNCLHLWKPTREQIPMPPEILVGIKSVGIIKTKKDADAVRRAAGLVHG